MTTITIKLAPTEARRDIYSSDDMTSLVKEMFASYEICESFTVTEEGLDAAEEAFDVTNNPGRQAEREVVYGRGRSVCVGDVVEVDGIDYLCSSFGWDVIA